MLLCQKGFKSDYCYDTNNQEIHIDDFINKYSTKESRPLIYCRHGHELQLNNGQTRKRYFKHKNSSDMDTNPMSEWHIEWQRPFPVTEYDLPKKEKQHKDRRVDIYIEKFNRIVEIQHSNITYAEISCREQDYQLHGLTSFWVVDGNTEDVTIDNFTDGNSLIKFAENWKYKSFLDSSHIDYILLDKDEKIYKIPVKKVKSRMILVKQSRTKKYIIDYLMNQPGNVYDLWEDDNEVKATLTVIQKGAGNGKTYGIWKAIVENTDKKTFIIITKMHTAKSTINEEFINQQIRGEYHIDDNIDNNDIEDGYYGKQLIIKYKHIKTDREIKIIIGTVDSFMYNLSSCNNISNDFFKDLLNQIKLIGCNKLTSNNGMRYGGESIHLNRETELWIDETQDLPIDYLHAIIKIIYQTKIDVVVVGDKLQSLQYVDNFMTSVPDTLPNIKVIKTPSENINRRIKVKNMSQKINKLVKFNEYDVEPIDISEDYLKEDIENPIEVISINKLEENEETIIEKVIKQIKYLIKKENTEPNDFLILFPIMKNNITATELCTKLEKFWIEHYSKESNYKQYVVLHKHEEGQVIDIKKSINSTRIMSIQSSKGDGRKYVFVLQCTEKSLKRCSENEINLLYESHLHVALTRSKRKTFFFLEANNDEIYKRFEDNLIDGFKPDIRTILNLSRIIEKINKIEVIDLLKKHIPGPEKTKANTKDNCETVDWEFHCIRRAIYIQYALYEILNRNEQNTNFHNSQTKIILDKLSKLPLEYCNPSEFYSYIRDIDQVSIDDLIKYKDFDIISERNKFSKKYPHINEEKINKLFHNELKNKKIGAVPYFPICKLSSKEIYTEYSRIFKEKIEENQKEYISNNYSLKSQHPLNAVIQTYMIQVYQRKKYHDTTPSTIYEIIHYFQLQDKTKETKMLEESSNIKKIVKKMIHNIPNFTKINWNIEHYIQLNGNDNFKIWYADLPIIGFDNKNVHHIKFITDLNELNYWDTMIEILIQRFLIRNPKGNSQSKNNKTRYEGKNIITYLIILKKNKYEKYEWTWETDYDVTIRNLLKDTLMNHFTDFNKHIFQYLTYVRNNMKVLDIKSPNNHMAEEYDKVNYLRDFFNDLQLKAKNDKVKYKSIVTDEKKFCGELTQRIVNDCETYLNLISDEDIDY